MKIKEAENHKVRTPARDLNYNKIMSLQKWLDEDYRRELDIIEMSEYLGFEYPVSKRELMKQAYKKIQEIKTLKGEEPLKEYKNGDFI